MFDAMKGTLSKGLEPTNERPVYDHKIVIEGTAEEVLYDSQEHFMAVCPVCYSNEKGTQPRFYMRGNVENLRPTIVLDGLDNKDEVKKSLDSLKRANRGYLQCQDCGHVSDITAYREAAECWKDEHNIEEVPDDLRRSEEELVFRR
jgi:hypothetical protein